MLLHSPFLDGVHFNAVPAHYEAIKHRIARPVIAGITCSGNLEVVTWAHKHKLDYVSFCSMFPSSSAGSCTIVMPSTVKQARTLTDMPIFVAGGITPENIATLRKVAPFNGVAVISGIMSAATPFYKVQEYQFALTQSLETK